MIQSWCEPCQKFAANANTRNEFWLKIKQHLDAQKILAGKLRDLYLNMHDLFAPTATLCLRAGGSSLKGEATRPRNANPEAWIRNTTRRSAHSSTAHKIMQTQNDRRIQGSS